MMYYALHCINCGAAEHSFGNLKYHLQHQCRMEPQIICGCCGVLFSSLAVLAGHINQPGQHLRWSIIPGYSKAMTISQLTRKVAEVKQKLNADSSAMPQLSATSVPASVSCLPAITSHSCPPFHATNHAVLPTQPCHTFPQTSTPSTAVTAAVSAPTTHLTSLLTRSQQESQRLRRWFSTLALHLVWLSSCCQRYVPVNAAPDASDLAYRTVLSALPRWPADLHHSNLPLSQLLDRLIPIYTDWSVQPPQED